MIFHMYANEREKVMVFAPPFLVSHIMRSTSSHSWFYRRLWSKSVAHLDSMRSKNHAFNITHKLWIFGWKKPFTWVVCHIFMVSLNSEIFCNCTLNDLICHTIARCNFDFSPLFGYFAQLSTFFSFLHCSIFKTRLKNFLLTWLCRPLPPAM